MAHRVCRAEADGLTRRDYLLGKFRTLFVGKTNPINKVAYAKLQSAPMAARAPVSLAWSPYSHNRQNGREFSNAAFQARGGLPVTGTR
jgi:hypothetical protein